jgi:Domain of unknown function (DUF222)
VPFLSVLADSVGMEMTQQVEGPDRVPDWLGAVCPDDLLTGSEVDELPDWDTDAALPTGAGLTDVPEAELLAPLSVGEVLFRVDLAGPGVEAISLLSSLTFRVLTASEQLSVLQAWQPQLAWVAGAETAAVAEFVALNTVPIPGRPVLIAPPGATAAEIARAAAEAGGRPIGPEEVFTAADLAAWELAPALGMSIDFARTRVRPALALAPGGALARVGVALRAGLLSDYKTRLLIGELVDAASEVIAAVQDRVLGVDNGAAAGFDPGRFRRLVRRTVKRLTAADPQAAVAAFVAARRTRGVFFDPAAVDGMVALQALLPPVEALAMQAHLEAAAGGRESFDGRSKNERMADLLIAAVLGEDPDHPRVPLTPDIVLQVLIDLPSLLGLQDTPAELPGFGELPAALVRALAGDAAWRRMVFDPVDGHLLDRGNKTHTPGPELDGYIRARDRFCRFPYSRRSAARADLDHTEPFDPTGAGNGGATSADNLAALSRGAHRLKTHGGHRMRHLGNGILAWETRLGRVYYTKPHDYRPDTGGRDRGTGDGDPEPPGVSG